ncbi:MAG: hypothetical protein ABT10_06760 [Novosphingobium sp. SCN 63-17]|nr:MAG: hypothetical protein ABT10_06760 [Novosphingobium sp. SCN 63-17]OJX96422.1 MAG: hypothetical protein BGP00_17865 [Novosphingobium sp. 63-713]
MSGDRNIRMRQRLRRIMGHACKAGVALALAGGLPLAAPQAMAQQEQIPVADAHGNWRYYPSPKRAPANAPNVLLVMTDDVGFGASSTFGGLIPTPNLDAVAANGLKYTQFHTTAMCSSTRASLLTGRNHHTVGNGSISNVSVDAPGYTSVIPATAATMGRILQDNGYVTSWYGKNHNTPDWETGPNGPYARWPNGMGFDYFYGFNGAGVDQVNPTLIENRNSIRRDPRDENYWFDKDMTNHALEWLSSTHGQQSDKPFFMYLATGAMHGPQQAPKEWVDKFKGQFDMGWDEARRLIFARQKAIGVIPANAKLAPPLRDVPAWSTLSADQKRLYARMMEIAAAQLAYFDFQFGRILDRLRETGQLDNTMIVFIQGDNGGALHNMDGSINAYSAFAGIHETAENLVKQIDKLGTEDSFGNYPVGWAYATNTPYPWGKTVASHLGGTRNGMVISWPARIKDKGGMRTQFGHVIDIAPTIYEAIGIQPPAEVDGVQQLPLDGSSMAYTFDQPKAPGRHREQYFEMLGSRAYYKDGWMASTDVPWDPWGANKTNPNTLNWELYDLNKDPSQTENVAAKYPAKLAELKADFDGAAKRFNVYPLSSDFFTRISQKYRPAGLTGGTSHVFYPGDTRYPAVTFPELSADWTTVASIATRGGKDSGPILVQGSRFAGYGLALDQGVPVFTYDPSGREQERRVLRAAEALGPGNHEITVRISPLDKGQQIALLVDGRQAAAAPIPRVIKIVTGDAIIGRPAIDDRKGPRLCDCEVRSVRIDSK